MAEVRTLFLRTFRGSRADHYIIATAFRALNGRGRVVVMGDSSGRQSLMDFWSALHSRIPLSRCIEYVVSDNSSWRADVHRQIVDADVIVLFLSPKDSTFPQIKHPPRNIRRDDFFNQIYATPLSRHMSGVGLLQEICYVMRLGAIPKTIAICRQSEFKQVADLIQSAEFAAMGIAHDMRLRNVVAPRLTALDQQLRWLKAAYGPIPFEDPTPGNEFMDGLAQRLESAYNDILTGRMYSVYEDTWGQPAYTYPRGLPSSELPLGRSESARRLPPDNKLKIFRFWNIEDLVSIPVGEVIDISYSEARGLMSKKAVQRGCPYCYAGIEKLCFHVYGLMWPTRNKDDVMAKCQGCGRRSRLWGDALVDLA